MLVPHQNPDGDALGSATALMHFLHQNDTQFDGFCATPVPPRHKYLPHIERVTNDAALWRPDVYDTLIVVDSGSLRYAGIDMHLSKLERRPTIINIDHHDTNEMFGDLNLVIPKASATTEVLYNFFKVNEAPVNDRIATSLLTGLITDTDNFTNAGTTVAALQIASELIKKGADANIIKNLMFKDKSVNVLKLWGVALSRLTKDEARDIVYTSITQNDLKTLGVSEDDVDGITNFLNNVSEGKARLLLKERPDRQVKGSFRATRDDVDVAKICEALGGGGHQKAAGFTVPGTVDEAIKKVWEAVESMSTKNERN